LRILLDRSSVRAQNAFPANRGSPGRNRISRWNDLGAFIFGFDNEDETVFKKTLQFAVESQIDAAQLNILVPFPGTRLRKRLKAEDRIIEKDWSKHMASNLCFKLKNMTPETFLEGYRWVKRKFHTIPRIVQRLAWASTRSGPLELSLLLGVNLGNRKAIKPV
jgi:hypothetical protein